MQAWISKLATATALALAMATFGVSPPAEAQQKVLKIQAAWPASQTVFEHLTMLAKRVDEMTAGQLKIEAMPAGQVVPAFEILDSVSKKVVDGGHAWAGYWVGKNKAAVLFGGGTAGPFGMDHMDFMSWVWYGGGQELYNRFYNEILKANVHVMHAFPASPQALGWFKKEINSLADFKGMKCRQTGISAEVYSEMGMRVVNMPGGEIMPAAERGVIDCAEWVGGIEDLRFGFHTIWKFHYAPSVHEQTSISELLINGDVWKGLTPVQREIVTAANTESLFKWWAQWQRWNAEAVVEMREKHAVQIRETPAEINTEFMKAWDKVAEKEAAKNPFFKEVYESQKKWASVSVPVKRIYFPAYSTAADHYWGKK
ncbi:MAG: TRAP transporter substrate-binding protein [Alphaproteobacteria bacterium]|nr:TRAP transporter substrate-binding protein [Alphaproteobacteria bacterium]